MSRLAAGLAILLAGVVYLNALDNPFVYDDQRLIVENRTLLEPFNVRALIRYELSRPVVNVSYAIDRAAWGPTPFGFHLTNLLLHATNVGLLFLLAFRLAGERTAAISARPLPDEPLVVAAAAALIFAVHPVMSQAVGYISGRAEVLCATWLLLALLSARAWMRTDRVSWLFATVGFWGLGLATKETAAMFPVLLLVYDWLLSPPPRLDRRRVLWLHVPLFLIVSLAVFLRLFVLLLIEHRGGGGPQWLLALVELDVVRRYLGLLLVPSGQTLFHAVRPVSGVLDPRVLVAVVAFTTILAIAWRLRARLPLVAFGVLWFFMLLVPSSMLVVLDRGEPMAEHRLYGASLGFFLVVGVIMGRLADRLERFSRLGRVVVAAALLVGFASLGGRTLLRNAIWSDPVDLWTEATVAAPGHWLPLLGLGEALAAAGRCGEAVPQLALSIRDNPAEPAAYSKLGVCLLELGDVDGARGVFQELRDRFPDSNEASNGLGTVALAIGDRAVARAYYEETLSRDPLDVPAHRGVALIVEPDDPAEALRRCETIAAIAPETPGNDECLSRNRARLASGSGSH